MRTDRKTTSIGIIGKGFVGTAVAHGFPIKLDMEQI